MCNLLADISAKTALALIFRTIFDDIKVSSLLSEPDRTRLLEISLKHLPDAVGENLKSTAGLHQKSSQKEDHTLYLHTFPSNTSMAF
jgi:hypothetical protein